jgi:hypothetical protein
MSFQSEDLLFQKGVCQAFPLSETSLLLFQSNSHHKPDFKVGDGSFGSVMSNVHL